MPGIDEIAARSTVVSSNGTQYKINVSISVIAFPLGSVPAPEAVLEVMLLAAKKAAK